MWRLYEWGDVFYKTPFLIRSGFLYKICFPNDFFDAGLHINFKLKSLEIGQRSSFFNYWRQNDFNSQATDCAHMHRHPLFREKSHFRVLQTLICPRIPQPKILRRIFWRIIFLITMTIRTSGHSIKIKCLIWATQNGP